MGWTGNEVQIGVRSIMSKRLGVEEYISFFSTPTDGLLHQHLRSFRKHQSFVNVFTSVTLRVSGDVVPTVFSLDLTPKSLHFQTLYTSVKGRVL